MFSPSRLECTLQEWEDTPNSINIRYVEQNVEVVTFIKARESLPVHCLNPRPWGNLRSPAKGGTHAILH